MEVTETMVCTDYRRNNVLCRLTKENDKEAESRILIENERLIIKIANDIANRRNICSSDGIDVEDLIQEGRIAILTAAKVFEEEMNVKFSTLAYEVIRNAMIDLCDKCQSSFERHLEAKGLQHLFLDDTEATDRASHGIGKDGRYPDPTGNEAVLRVMILKMFNRVMALPVRNRKVILFRYGLSTPEIKSVSETATYFHLSEKNARSIENCTLKMLRTGMEDGKLL